MTARRAVIALRARTVRDFLRLWPMFDASKADQTFLPWLAGVQAVIARDHARAISLGAEQVAAFRRAARVPGRPVVVKAAPPADAVVEARMRIVTVVAVKRAASRGSRPAQAGRAAFSLASGVAGDLVLSGVRDTITGSSVADPAVVGWQRTGAGDCAFCAMLIGRNAVYREESVGFASHAHCVCSAEPAFGPGVTSSVADYTPSARTITDADRSRVAKYLATHHAG
jgi:hypothetical protein